MSVLRNKNLYAGGMLVLSPYLRDGFVFDYDIQPKYKILIVNGKKVRV